MAKYTNNTTIVVMSLAKTIVYNAVKHAKSEP